MKGLLKTRYACRRERRSALIVIWNTLGAG